MLLNVRLIGSGKQGDDYRANLPTYRMVTTDYDNHVAIVDVPDSTLGLSKDDLANEQAHKTTEGDLYTQLSADNLDKAKAHLDKAYPGKGHAIELVDG